MSMELHLTLLAAKCPPELAGAISTQMDCLQSQLAAERERANTLGSEAHMWRAQAERTLDERDRAIERAGRLQRVVDEMVRTLNGVVGASPKHWEMSMDQFCEEFVPWARSRARMLLDMAAAQQPDGGAE